MRIRLRGALENLLQSWAFMVFWPEDSDVDGRQNAISTIAAAPPGALPGLSSSLLQW